MSMTASVISYIYTYEWPTKTKLREREIYTRQMSAHKSWPRNEPFKCEINIVIFCMREVFIICLFHRTTWWRRKSLKTDKLYSSVREKSIIAIYQYFLMEISLKWCQSGWKKHQKTIICHICLFDIYKSGKYNPRWLWRTTK